MSATLDATLRSVAASPRALPMERDAFASPPDPAPVSSVVTGLTLGGKAGAAPNPAALAPAMSDAEQALLRAAATGATAMLEFGCGGSTGLLLEVGERLLSLDSDAAWLARVAASLPGAVSAGRLLQHHADIGPLGDWGWPLRPPTALDGLAYWAAPWSVMPAPDFVLVDGRFRIACALAAHARLAPGGLLAIHDFWNRRVYQDGLAGFYEAVGSADTMALLQPRAVAPEQLAAALERHAADPR